MMKPGIKNFVFCLLLTVPAGLFAANDAGRESPFSFGSGAAAMGMGGGFTALANNSSAVYYNPAGLAGLEYHELSALHSVLFEGTIYNTLSWVYPFEHKGGIGLSAMRIGTGDIVRRVNWSDQGTFGYSKLQVMGSAGFRLHPGFSVGGTIKVLNQRLDDYSDYAFTGDVGLKLDIYRFLSLGLVARDIYPAKLDLNGVEERQPFSLAGGIALNRIKLSENTALTLSFDLEKHEDRDITLHTGAELSLFRQLFIRGGFDRDNLALGGGLKYRPLNLQVDYAYKFMEYIEDSHTFTLSFFFGTSVSDKIRARQLRQQRQRTQVEVDEKQKQIDILKQKGDAFFRRYEFDSSLHYYQRALQIDEGNQEILDAIAAVRETRHMEEQRQEVLRKARKELEQFIDRNYLQAEKFYEAKYYSAAKDMLQLIFEIDPQNLKALELQNQIKESMAEEISKNFSQADADRKAGKIVAAIESYNRILELEPDNADALTAKDEIMKSLDVSQRVNLGIRLYQLGQYHRARRQFQAVLDIDPNEPVAKEYLQKMQLAPEKIKAATLEELQKDKEVWPLYLEGMRYMRNKEYAKAIEAWEKVLKVYPGNTNTLENIRQARLRLDSENSE